MLRTLRLRPLAVPQFVANMYDTHISLSGCRRRHPMNSIWILGTSNTPEQTSNGKEEAQKRKKNDRERANRSVLIARLTPRYAPEIILCTRYGVLQQLDAITVYSLSD